MDPLRRSTYCKRVTLRSKPPRDPSAPTARRPAPSSPPPETALAAEGPGPPLAGLTFAVAGPGRVGSSLARWLVAGGGTLTAVGYHRRRRAAEDLAAEVAAEAAGRAGTGGGGGGAGRPRIAPPRVVPLARLESGQADLLLVTVADPALDRVAALLAQRPQAPVVLHSAGSRGASALAPLAAAGCATGTLHPLKAFPRPLPAPSAGRGVTFGVDGAPAAVETAERLARSWGGLPLRVPEEARTLYHLAATLAAGGVTTLLAAAQRIAAAAGVPPEVLGGYLELARGALAAAGEELGARGSVAGAITGPAARGDRETVDRQLRALAEVRPRLCALVALLGREALVAMAEEGDREEGTGATALGDDQRRLLRALEAATPSPDDETGQGLW